MHSWCATNLARCIMHRKSWSAGTLPRCIMHHKLFSARILLSCIMHLKLCSTRTLHIPRHILCTSAAHGLYFWGQTKFKWHVLVQTYYRLICILWCISHFHKWHVFTCYTFAYYHTYIWIAQQQIRMSWQVWWGALKAYIHQLWIAWSRRTPVLQHSSW